MALILKKGFFCIIEKEPNETSNEAFMRGWFIVSQTNEITQNQSDSANLIKYSKLWNNNRQHNCKYNSNIMDKLIQYEGHMYSVHSDFNR